MPELPEVETVRRGLEPVLVGARIASVTLNRTDLRRPFPKGFAKSLTDRRVEGLDRRGKFLVARLEDNLCLVMHLGMSGSFRITDGSVAAEVLIDRRHDHVIFKMSSGAEICFNDPRRFGSMDLVGNKRLDFEPPLAGLGIEPLGPDLTATWIAERLRARSTPIKSALLDQRNIAGLGNIYVCEALWEARISPLRPAARLVNRRGRPTLSLQRLPQAIRTVLHAAIDSGGSSLRNHIRTDGSFGMFQHSFSVYGREGGRCRRPGCGGTINRTVQAGRSTFYCPRCQR